MYKGYISAALAFSIVLYYLVCNRTSTSLAKERDKLDREDSNDLFRDYYQTNELTELDLLFSFNLPSSSR